MAAAAVHDPIRQAVRAQHAAERGEAPPLLCARQQLPPDCYAHILLEDEHLPATTMILTDFQIAMSRLAEEMERRNERRGGYACNSFNPLSMTSSVSI